MVCKMANPYFNKFHRVSAKKLWINSIKVSRKIPSLFINIIFKLSVQNVEMPRSIILIT